MESNSNEEGDSVVAIVVAIVVIAVVLLFIFLAFRGNSVVSPVYSFTTDITGSSTAFTGDNYTAATVTTATGSKALVITAPVDAVGKQFIVDNSIGVGTVTLTGVTMQNADPSTNKVAPKSVGIFLWKSQTVLLRVT